MKPVAWSFVLIVGVVGCADNEAPGNDREAQLDPPPSPAPVMSAAEALAGVDVGVLMPQIMTQADLRVVPDAAGGCRFRMTRVDTPTFLYPSGGTGDAVVKLNGTLIRLAGTGTGTYRAGGIEATLQPLQSGSLEGGQFEASWILRLPGAPNELGFHGYAEC